MSALSVTNTFVAGTIIRAAHHNQNMTDIITWANGNIGADNLDTLTDTVDWSISTNVLGLNSVNTGTEGSMLIAHNGTLATAKSAVKISSNAAQSLGTALLEITSSNAASNIPALKITDPGAGPSAALEIVSTTKGSIPMPKMTTTQRNAITSPVAGTQVFDTTVGIPFYYNSGWKHSLNETSVDNTTIEISSEQLRVKDQGITNAKIADATIIAEDKLVDDPVFPGTKFSSAGSGGTIDSQNNSYSLDGVARNTLAVGYNGGAGKGFRIIAGRVSDTGGVNEGEGFTATRLVNPGQYRVTLNDASSSILIAVVSAYNSAGTSFQANSVKSASNSFDVFTYNSAGSALVNREFTFICVVDVA